MSSTIVTFVFEVLNFVALAALLGWLFFDPVRRMIDQRRTALAAQAHEAAAHLAEAEKVRHDVDAMRAGLAAELDVMQQRAEDSAREQAETLLSKARDEAQRQRRVVLAEAWDLQRAQTARLAVAVTHAAHDVVVRLLARIGGDDLEGALLRAAQRELEHLQRPLAPVTVESAHPLSADAQHALEVAASVDAARWRVLPDLVAGVRVLTARGLVDASVGGLADFAEHALAEEMQALLRADDLEARRGEDGHG